MVSGLDPVATDLSALCATFRRTFATGSSVKQGAIELQGDHRDAVVEHLRALGYAAKAAGG